MEIALIFHLKGYPIIHLFGTLYNFIHVKHPLLWHYLTSGIDPQRSTTSIILALSDNSPNFPRQKHIVKGGLYITVALPFIPHLTDRIIKVWRNTVSKIPNLPELRFIKKPPNKQWYTDLSFTETQQIEKNNVIYAACCNDCPDRTLYIGETARSLAVRSNEHLKNYDGRSAVGNHCKSSGHVNVSFKPIHEVRKIYNRRIMEKLLIDKFSPTLNTKSDCLSYISIDPTRMLNLFKFKF